MRGKSVFGDLHRFMKKVEKTDYCWDWTSMKNKKGYGQFWFEGTVVFAHRWLYGHLIDPVPDDLIVCHHCDNPSCVNPGHLFIGTHQDNHDDMVRKGRQK